MNDVQNYVNELMTDGRLTQQELASRVSKFSNVKVTQSDIFRFKEGTFKRPTFEKVDAVRKFYLEIKRENATASNV